MKKFASFIPVIGILLVFYLLGKGSDRDDIWPNNFCFFGSAITQAFFISLIIILI